MKLYGCPRSGALGTRPFATHCKCQRVSGNLKIVWQNYPGCAEAIIAAPTMPAPGAPKAREAVRVASSRAPPPGH